MRVGAVVAVRDQLGEHRVVVRGDLGAALDPGVHPQVVGEAHLRQHAGGRLEVLVRVLGVQTRLHRVAARLRASGWRAAASRPRPDAPSTRRGPRRSPPRSRRARPAAARSLRGRRIPACRRIVPRTPPCRPSGSSRPAPSRTRGVVQGGPHLGSAGSAPASPRPPSGCASAASSRARPAPARRRPSPNTCTSMCRASAM